MEPLDELRKQRLDKLNKILEINQTAYAYTFAQTDFAQDIIEQFDTRGEGFHVAVSGRLMSIRRMGKASFGHIMDKTGRIQIYLKQDKTGESAYTLFKLLDIGDFIGICGNVFRTKTGEITIVCESIELLAKTLRPLPVVKEKIEDDEKIIYDQFSDKELRYRQRYVDLIVNPDVKNVFIARSRIISVMRRYLENQGFIEVETPVLQSIYGGAFARPFITHHNALDVDLYLRIADELYLKRLIVGGFDGVFEIAKDFRNEGMDRDHNPEFTMMELYVAYQDYQYMMDLVEDMIRSICQEVFNNTKISYQGQILDFAKPWTRIGFFESIKMETGEDCYGKDEKELRKIIDKLKIEIDPSASKANMLDTIFSEFVEPKLFHPTFICDYPVELSPLAKKHRKKAGLVERFEGYAGGKELCNAFSELNDPIDQRERFENQAALRAEGDEEAMVIDEDYLRALEYGMPPTAGLGIGVDRLVMLLTNASSIRDVILFPHMRPEKS
ncbi:lysine--tRNA ligase [bacterium]|nr:lysine--tRNA ligase [bacterium]